jgi:hypothetical protein
MIRKSAYLVLLGSMFLTVLIGCASGDSAPSGTTAEIVDKVFAKAQVENFGMTQALVTGDDYEFFLGSRDYPDFAEATAVMPMINIDTRVMIVIKAADMGDVAELTAKLQENVDPNRVVCVTFTMEDVAIESRGDVVFLTINTDAEQRTALVEAFQNID